MKHIYYKIIPILLLFFTVGVFGQQDSDYYYYKGEKINLKINRKKISISFSKESSIGALKAFNTIFTESSEIIKDHTRESLNVIDSEANNRKELNAFYIEMSSDNNLSITDYYNQIELYKNFPNTIIVSPSYLTKEGVNIGLSNNFYVKLKSKNDVDILYNKAKELNVEVLGYNKYMPLWFTLSIKSPQKLNALNLSNIFYESGLFESTEPAFIYKNLQNSNDPYFNDQWTLKNTGQSGGNTGVDIDIEEAWNITTGGNVKVAVLDQGIEMNHPDLQSNIYGNGFDAQTNTTPSQVRGSHGTACAGIIGAVKDNNIGIAGVAPSSNLISVSVSFSGTTIQMLANGINWAVENGADVISNSWGGGAPSPLFDDAIDNAFTNGRNGLGCVVVFSSGNDNVNGAQYPSNSNPSILCVGAIDRCGVRSGRIDIVPQSCDPWGSRSCSKPGSSFGTPLDIVAGGTSISTTDRQGSQGYNPSASSCAVTNNYLNQDYNKWFGGTSASCPYVSGVAALVLSVNPNLTFQEVNTIIEQSAQKVRTDLYSYSNTSTRPNGTWNNELGYGLVNAHQAVLMAQSSGCSIDRPITQNVNTGQTDNQQASNSITATNIINSGATANYDAGNTVFLRPGFHAKNGANFRAFIQGCSTNRSRFSTKIREDQITYTTSENLEAPNELIQNTDFGIKIYPNPTSSNLSIESNTSINSWMLLNPFGHQLKGNTNLNAKKAELNVSGLTTGIYFLKIQLDSGNTIIKRVIKK